MTVGVAFCRVGILSEDDDADILGRNGLERREDLVRRWQDYAILCLQRGLDPRQAIPEERKVRPGGRRRQRHAWLARASASTRAFAAPESMLSAAIAAPPLRSSARPATTSAAAALSSTASR